jgi:hypothetical protein
MEVLKDLINLVITGKRGEGDEGEIAKWADWGKERIKNMLMDEAERGSGDEAKRMMAVEVT